MRVTVCAIGFFVSTLLIEFGVRMLASTPFAYALDRTFTLHPTGVGHDYLLAHYGLIGVILPTIGFALLLLFALTIMVMQVHYTVQPPPLTSTAFITAKAFTWYMLVTLLLVIYVYGFSTPMTWGIATIGCGVLIITGALYLASFALRVLLFWRTPSRV